MSEQRFGVLGDEFYPVRAVIFVYNTSFVTRWVLPATQGTRGWGCWVFRAQGRIVFASTLNADIRTGAVAFGVPIKLAPSALNDMNFLHIAQEFKVVYALVVVVVFQIYRAERQGFLRYMVRMLRTLRTLCPSVSSSA